MKTIRTTLLAAAMAASMSSISSAEDLESPAVLRIPRLAQAPKLDGKLDPGEWDGAAAVTGLRALQFGSALAPAAQQAVFYLAYDARFLYLAMRSPLETGRYPVAACVRPDGEGILHDDRVEWQILKHSREQATQQGFGFYKLVINPFGIQQDAWHFNGTPGSEILWESGGAARCAVTAEAWTLEAAVALSALGVGNLDGKTWAMQLARCDGVKDVGDGPEAGGDARGPEAGKDVRGAGMDASHAFCGWGPGTWLEWKGFPEVIFDPDAPSVQWLDLGEPTEGRLQVRAAVCAAKGRAQNVALRVRATDAKGAELFAEKKDLSVADGARAETQLERHALTPDADGIRLTLEALEGDKVLYRAAIPVRPLTEAYRTEHLEPWRKNRGEKSPTPPPLASRASAGLLERLVLLNSYVNRLEQAMSAEQARGNLDAIEKLCRRMIQEAPWAPNGYYNLACLHALRGNRDEAFRQLDEAIAHGFNRSEHLKADTDWIALRDDPRFAAAVERAVQAPAFLPDRPATPLPILEQTAWVRDENLEYDRQRRMLRSAFRFDPAPPADRPFTTLKDPAGELLLQWQKDGTAAGNWGDLYDNRDGDHSDLPRSLFPTLTWIEYATEARAANLHWGLQNDLIHPGIVLGNASVAQTGGPFWRSMPRMACSSAHGVALLYDQYRGNRLYVYPGHLDHSPGRDGLFAGEKGGHGDVFFANTPYLIASQGSSGSDQVFLQAIAATLAAFRPETKRRLAEQGLLMPAVQMIFRMSNKAVSHPEIYLTGVAHHAVFQGNQIDREKMVTRAHEMMPGILPPLAQIEVVEEDQPKPGRDFFSAHKSEKHFDSPCAVARIFRGVAYRRRMVVSAEKSLDADGRPLAWRWVVLRGDARKIRIRPLDEKGSKAELSVPYHPRRPVSPGHPLESNRVEIGVFAHNGTYWSPPAFITFFSLDHEERVYDEQDRIRSVTYTGADEPGHYVDPVIELPRSWRDEYRYDAEGRCTGWTRTHGERTEEFDAEGRLIVRRNEDGTVAETREVRYVPKTRKPGEIPVLVAQ